MIIIYKEVGSLEKLNPHVIGGIKKNMAFISRDEFLKQQAARQERAAAAQNAGPRVSYFSLKDDGDEAVVRFAYNSPDEFDILTTHQTSVDGKFRRVNCLRDFKDPVDNCPMCKAGIPVQQRFYIKLVEYTRDEEGKVVATPKVWERPTSYVTILNNLFTEYGDVADCVFKVKRSGKKGDMQTTYSIMLANPTIYNTNTYPKDFSGFDGYNVVGSALLNWTPEQMNESLGVTETKPEEPVKETTYTQAAPRRVTY